MRNRLIVAAALLLAACGSDPVAPFYSGDATGLDAGGGGDASLDDAGLSDAGPVDGGDDDVADDASDDTDEDTGGDTADDGGGDTTDDGGGDTSEDGGTDTTEDTGGDTSEDGGTDTTEDTTDDTGGPTCGDGAAEGAESCDGADLRGATCETLGFDGGALSCAADCTSYVTSGCLTTCTPECDGRECGPDPACGISCGGCGDGVCTTDGSCQAPAERGPRIVSFEANRLRLGEGAEITFTAVVTDPDGADDVVAGTLADAIEGATYRSFSRSDGAAWSVTVTWDELNDVVPIEFDEDVGRTLQARFFDNDGNVATALTTVTLTCDGRGACDGTCTDLGSDANCGDCGNVCTGDTFCDGGLCACPGGGALCGGVCTPLGTTSNCTACNDACAGGATCGSGGCVCPTGQVVCDGVCTPLATTTNCTACGEVCAGGTECTPEGCACPDGEALCGGVCRPLGTVDDCLGCGDSCDAFGAICGAGGCQCPAARVECDGACVELGTTSDCLACGDVCTGGRSCTDTGCACLDGQELCGGVCTFTDTALNCGGCDLVCSADGQACVDGVCACPDGDRLCDGACGTLYENATCGDACASCSTSQRCDGNLCQLAAPHELRLGRTGALEVYLDAGWRSVCGVGFGETDAAAACRQLGGELLSYATGVPVDVAAPYGISNLGCGITEQRLTACSYTTVTTDCPEDGGVSVVCSAPVPVPADCSPIALGSVKINEIYAAGSSSFVELYGPANRDVTGLRLEHWERTGGILQSSVTLSGTLTSTGYGSVGGSNITGRVGVLTSPYPTTSNQGYRLVNCDGSIVDAVGWGLDLFGYTNTGEGFDLPSFTRSSFGRYPNGIDTNDNGNDIVALNGPTRHLANTPYVVPVSLPRSFSGSISGSESTFVRPNTACTPGTTRLPYDLVALNNTQTTALTVRLTARFYDDTLFFTDEIPGYLVVYFGGFNASSPTADCDRALSGQPATGLITIPASTTLYVAVTKANESDDIDEWSLTIAAP